MPIFSLDTSRTTTIYKRQGSVSASNKEALIKVVKDNNILSSVMATFNFLCSLWIFCVSIFHPIISCHAIISKPKQSQHAALYVFGDSLFDSGNNQYINGSPKGVETSWPYGETFFKHPTGRRSDGRLVPDFIATFAGLPMPPPYLQPGAHNFTDGSNFASGGSGVLQENAHGTIHLGMQLNYFKAMGKLLRQKIGDKETKKLMRKSVYLFSSGGNDLHSFYTAYPDATQLQKHEYVRMLTGNITNILREIYDMGGRKFAFQNVAPLGCLPGTLETTGGACDQNMLALAQLHNKILSDSLSKKLASRLPEFKYSIFSYYTSLRDMIINPSKYGFKYGKMACCGSGALRAASCGLAGKYELCSNPKEYVWFDGGHTTECTNAKLAELMWNGAPNIVGHYNLKQFFEEK